MSRDIIFSQATKNLKMFYFTHRLGKYSKSKITPLHLLHEHLTKKFTPVALTDIKQKKIFHKMFVESCDLLCLTIRSWSWMKLKFPLLFLLGGPEHFKDRKHKDFSSFFKHCENALLRTTAVMSMDSVWTLLYPKQVQAYLNNL